MSTSSEIPEYVEVAVGAGLLLLMAAVLLVHVLRNLKDAHWRRGMLQLIVGTTAVTVLLPVWIYYNSKYFHGWKLARGLVAQIFLFVLVCYLIRWSRYPGIYQSQSGRRLAAQVLLFTLLVLSLPLLAVVLWAASHLFVRVPLNIKGLAVRLGMSFKHNRGDPVSFPGPSGTSLGTRIGRISNIRVVSRSEISVSPEPVGSVVYEVEFPDGMRLEVPEHALETK